MTTASLVTPTAESAACAPPPSLSPAPPHAVSIRARARKPAPYLVVLMVLLLFGGSEKSAQLLETALDAAGKSEHDDDEDHAVHREREVVGHVGVQVQC